MKKIIQICKYVTHFSNVDNISKSGWESWYKCNT